MHHFRRVFPALGTGQYHFPTHTPFDPRLTPKQYHSEKQDIDCPGCSKHFVHFSAFVRHVEFHECPVISSNTAAARCEKELEFAKALEVLDRKGQGKNRIKDFSVYLNQGDRSTNHLPARPVVDNGQSFEAQVPQQSDFPRLPKADFHAGGSKVPDLLTGNENQPLEEHAGRWASDGNLFPDAPPAQGLTTDQMMEMQALWAREDRARDDKAMAKARGVVTADPNDPTGPNFHPKSMYCPYTKTYKCPICIAK